MLPEAFEEFIHHMERLDALVKEGKLPNDSHIYQRLAYVGHKVKYSYYQKDEDKVFRCVSCMQEWSKFSPDRICPDILDYCQNCPKGGEAYQINYDRSCMWECLACHQEWYGEIGWECPHCGSLKDPPRYTCKKCSYQWIGEDNICSECGDNYYRD